MKKTFCDNCGNEIKADEAVQILGPFPEMKISLHSKLATIMFRGEFCNVDCLTNTFSCAADVAFLAIACAEEKRTD